MNLGINLDPGCVALMGRWPDPNGILISGSRVCKLWSETHPGVGTIGPASPSAIPATNTWTEAVKVTRSATDLYGTTETGRHYNYLSSLTGAVATRWGLEVSCEPKGNAAWVRFDLGNNSRIHINVATGEVGNASAGVSATVATFGSTFGVVIKKLNVTAFNLLVEFLPSNVAVDNVPNFAMSAADGLANCVYTPVQTRAASHNNLARNTDGSLVDATGGVQGTAPNQPLILDPDGNFYVAGDEQIPVLSKENGRVAFLDYTDADVAAVASGDDPAWWAMGIGKYASPPVTLLYFYGAGSIRHTLWINVAGNVYLTRHDGTNYHDVQLGTATALASWAAWALQVRADRTISLWVAGTERTGTQNNLAAATMTGLRLGHDSATTGTFGRLMIAAGSGDLGSYTAFQPALRAMCARYSPYVGSLVA